MHYVKILELLSIAKYNDKTYLHIRLSSEHETELFWDIDHATATSLIGIFECNGHHKYRISLHSTYDLSRDQFVSSLTKTYRDLSEPIFFDCSVDYKNGLDYIKSSQSINELTSLPFIFTNLPAIDEDNTPTISEHNEVIIKKRSFPATFSWIVAIISVVLITIAVFSHHFVNKAAMDSAVVMAAPPKITNTAIHATIEIDNNIMTTATTTVDNDTTGVSLPYIKTDESITYSIPEGYVALTFDDGPSKYTMAITDILMEYNAGGTFFFLGINAKKHPESVRYAYENGYAIGNHSMKHSDMTKLSVKEQEEELLQAAEALEDIIKEKVLLFRPPYGALNDEVTELIQTHQFKIIQWNKDPEDWKTQDSDKIINYVREANASGSIIILHESQAVIDALPKIIEILQEQNLKIVNLQ